MSEPQITGPADAVFSLALQRPINAWGKTLEQIHFREPRAGDITRHGRPVNYTPGYDFKDITFDEAKMTAMLAALAGVPASSIDTLSTQDWTDCAWGITRFFIPGLPTTRAGAPSSSPSTSAATSSTISTDQPASS